MNFLVFLNGAFTIIGHDYPFFMNFKGGKGTASLIGLLLALDWRMAITLITVITNYIVFGTIVMLLSFCVTTVYFNYGVSPAIITVMLLMLSIYKHIPNIKRIIRKEEKGLRNIIKKKR